MVIVNKKNAAKHDDGKVRYELVPIGALHQVARALTFGAEKYGEGDWIGGLKWSRYIGAILRHLYAFAGGETHDEESGLHHLAHAAAVCLMLLSFTDTLSGTDDRNLINTNPFFDGVKKYNESTRKEKNGGETNSDS